MFQGNRQRQRAHQAEPWGSGFGLLRAPCLAPQQEELRLWLQHEGQRRRRWETILIFNVFLIHTFLVYFYIFLQNILCF